MSSESLGVAQKLSGLCSKNAEYSTKLARRIPLRLLSKNPLCPEAYSNFFFCLMGRYAFSLRRLYSYFLLDTQKAVASDV